MTNENLKLAYTILCDDVRLELGNKLSLMGLFQNVMVERVPVSLIKFAVVQHWLGEGRYVAEVRILAPDKLNVVAASQPTQVVLEKGGFADNVSFFFNAHFPETGVYSVQTLVDSSLFDEFPLVISDVNRSSAETNGNEFPEILN